MCLDRKEENVNLPRWGYGWKVFLTDGKDLYPQFEGKVKPYKVGRWYNAVSRAKRFLPILHNFYGLSYPNGFHIMRTKAGADYWKVSWERFSPWEPTLVIRKVRYRKTQVLGSQENCEVIVAREMKILRRREE